MIAIIDYRAGNAPSVLNALRRIGASGSLTSSPELLKSADAIILPGVGSADATVSSLDEMGLLNIIEKRVIEDKVPFLGICVGLQVLFEHSEEGDTKCLGWFKGEVRRFSERVRVPQIGWNEVNFKGEHPLIRGCGPSDFFYFVNSYYIVPEDESLEIGTTDYDGTFCSLIAKDNVMASQFHLEKSGEAGLKILKNFANIASERGDLSC